MKPLKLIPDNTTIRFIEKKWLALSLSTLLIVATFALLATRGLNFGIDFTGGTVIESRAESDIELDVLRTALSAQLPGEVGLQQLETPRDVLIRVQQLNGGNDTQFNAVNIVKAAVQDTLSGTIDYRKVDVVGPQVGGELIQAGALSLGLAILAILIYISIRFEWQFGLGAIAALVHDVILVIGLYSLLNIEFNLSSIAAILTVIGYSINDSVVIFDRIRETMRKYKKLTIIEVLNRSLNDTLSRTILTAGTTVLALIALVTLGGPVIYGFSVAVLFGVIIGTYSSIYIAASTLTFLSIDRQ